MELRDFIKNAIVDICEATKSADAEVRKIGGLVNPSIRQQTVSSAQTAQSSLVHSRTTLTFDVAISAERNTNVDAGAKTKIWVVEASIGGGGGQKDTVASRLSFSIDVVLPEPVDQVDRIGLVQKK